MADSFFHNPSARAYNCQKSPDVLPQAFHSQLPNFKQTPLTPVPQTVFGLNHVFVKDESERIGLPSFKILGASWGTFRALVHRFGLPLDSSLETVQKAAVDHNIHLVTATDGNHGRAIARMAKLLGVRATIFVPDTVNEYTRNLIRSEGAAVRVEIQNYDAAVMTAYHYANEVPERLYVQDTSFEGYHDIPAWIVQGYTTMLAEVADQLKILGLKATHIFTPVGVGSLANAVVAHCKSDSRSIAVIAVESELAACLLTSLRDGEITPISTEMTIMDGINCGTVSDISWPVLRDGVDAAITISDQDSHKSVLALQRISINAGPCGASTTAALFKLKGMEEACLKLNLGDESVVVLLNTEGTREYTIPAS